MMRNDAKTIQPYGGDILVKFLGDERGKNKNCVLNALSSLNGLQTAGVNFFIQCDLGGAIHTPSPDFSKCSIIDTKDASNFY